MRVAVFTDAATWVQVVHFLVTLSYQRTWYAVTAPEPTDDGAVHEALAVLAVEVFTANDRGAVAVPATMLFDVGDATETLLAELVAFTVNVYDLPLVSPETEHDNAGAVEPTFDVEQVRVDVPTLGEAVTVYPVIVAPPFLVGAFHVTRAPAVFGEATGAVSPVGATATMVKFVLSDEPL